MNREIKFRAFETELARGRMFEWEEIRREFMLFLNCKETFVMQFTGQEDAQINGNEVYESDIIENCDTKALQVVYWNDDKAAWYCRYVQDEKRVVSLSDSLGNLNKVVGNIYENPELIK